MAMSSGERGGSKGISSFWFKTSQHASGRRRSPPAYSSKTVEPAYTDVHKQMSQLKTVVQKP
jgi:hypothetical protein